MNTDFRFALVLWFRHAILRRPQWFTNIHGHEVNVMPFRDSIGHHRGAHCICGPAVEDHDHPHGATQVITHNSLDGREVDSWRPIAEPVR